MWNPPALTCCRCLLLPLMNIWLPYTMTFPGVLPLMPLPAILQGFPSDLPNGQVVYKRCSLQYLKCLWAFLLYCCHRRVLVAFLALHWSTEWDDLHSYGFRLRSCGEWCLDLRGMMGSTWVNVALHGIPNIQVVWIPSFFIPE